MQARELFDEMSTLPRVDLLLGLGGLWPAVIAYYQNGAVTMKG